MDADITRALETDRTIDITTTGRKSGSPRKVEIWFHNIDGRIFITGTPGTRDWYANMVANSAFTFHLKGSVQADLPATARPLVDEAERRDAFTAIFQKLEGDRDLEAWMVGSPLVEVDLEGR